MSFFSRYRSIAHDVSSGDMTGAASCLGSLIAIAQLKLPLSVAVVCPLTENLPSGKATKPADVVFARNGVSIEIGNTDAEGRLVLADAINYAEERFAPRALIDVATLTGAVGIALGPHYAGAFSRSKELWKRISELSFFFFVSFRFVSF